MLLRTAILISMCLAAPAYAGDAAKGEADSRNARPATSSWPMTAPESRKAARPARTFTG